MLQKIYTIREVILKKRITKQQIGAKWVCNPDVSTN